MNVFSDIGAEKSIRLFSLARYALLEGLAILGVSPGQKVLVPAFICRDLLASIYSAGAEPVFYPVDRSLAPQLLPMAPNVKAVLAVNYFGFPQELEPFRVYCSAHGACLIEDNAHGFLSRDTQGRLLGSRGDLGIFSLRKTFTMHDGAALLLNRKDWDDRLPTPLPCRYAPLPANFVVKRALKRIQNTTGIRVRSFSEQVTRHFRRLRTGHALPITLPESEVEIPGEPAIHCDSESILEKIDEAREVKRRRDLYHSFHHDFRQLNIEPIFGTLAPGVAPYGYPFRANKFDAATVARVAYRRGFDCSRWPDLPSVVAADAPEFYRNVWWVNFLC